MMEEYPKVKIEGVPFIPATDLWKAQSKHLTLAEVVAVALSLYQVVQDVSENSDKKEKWGVYSRARAIDRHVLARRS